MVLVSTRIQPEIVQISFESQERRQVKFFNQVIIC
jgi:hypothetical protein